MVNLHLLLNPQFEGEAKVVLELEVEIEDEVKIEGQYYLEDELWRLH